MRRRVGICGLLCVLLIGAGACARDEEPGALERYRSAFNDEKAYTGPYVVLLRSRIDPTEAEVQDFISEAERLNHSAGDEDLLPLFYIRITRNVIQLIYGAQNRLYGIQRTETTERACDRIRERYPHAFWLKIR